MNIAAEYERQYAWRDWQIAYRSLPGLKGKSVLDLGCAVGDQSRELARLGATVIGIDLNPQLVAVAADKDIEGATFMVGDVRDVRLPAPVDGIWSSFTAAYFPQFAPVLSAWSALINPGGWVALTEVDNLFGHEPLPRRSSKILEDYAAESLSANRYDFSMGRKLASHMAAAGFEVVQETSLNDRELSFEGAAHGEIVQAWADRFDRMARLKSHAGAEYGLLRTDFLACLTSPDHRAASKVCFCIGTKSR